MNKNTNSLFAIVAVGCGIIFSSISASAEVQTPKIRSAKFDANGKLVVSATHTGAYEGCYLVVNGGLKTSAVSTQIVGIQLTAAQATAGKTTIKTARKYYCRQRTLYVNAEVICLGDEVAQKASSVAKVSVPTSNVRRQS